jgi:hypothetical protein
MQVTSPAWRAQSGSWKEGRRVRGTPRFGAWDDDAALGHVAADFRELVSQALAELGFEEIHFAGGDLPELLREQAAVDQERPARLGSHRSDA